MIEMYQDWSTSDLKAIGQWLDREMLKSCRSEHHPIQSACYLFEKKQILIMSLESLVQSYFGPSHILDNVVALLRNNWILRTMIVRVLKDDF